MPLQTANVSEIHSHPCAQYVLRSFLRCVRATITHSRLHNGVARILPSHIVCHMLSTFWYTHFKSGNFWYTHFKSGKLRINAIRRQMNLLQCTPVISFSFLFIRPASTSSTLTLKDTSSVFTAFVNHLEHNRCRAKPRLQTVFDSHPAFTWKVCSRTGNH